ncbi:MAG: glycosyltransferase family 4 protein [Bacteroidota bacterium]|nr:glycosyltransferase family 4 protein [Bacteroidota bacterium]
MSGSKKILIITTEFPPGPGGIGNHAFNLAKYLNLNDIQTKVLTISDFAGRSEELEFDSKHKFEIIRFKRYSSRVKTYLQRLKIILKEVKHNRPTHIIFSGRTALMSSLMVKRTYKNIRLIAIAHGGDINVDNLFESALVNKALSSMDLIIPVSNYSKSKIKLKIRIKEKKVVVIPNGFDFEYIESLSIKDKTLRNGSLTLVTVGTVWPRKGHHNVLNALPKIISNFPQTKYNIIGRLTDLSKVKNFIEDEKLKQYINIHGPISNKEMHDVLNQSQIFILLSESQTTGDFEGFGIAVLEANYFGLPAIGSRNSGLEDAISNGVSGILVDPWHVNEVSDAVTSISKNYSKFSEGAKQWALQHHWSNIIKRYIKAIENIK